MKGMSLFTKMKKDSGRKISDYKLDGKKQNTFYADNYESIEIDSDFESWRTGNVNRRNIRYRIQDDLIKAELVSGPLTLIILGIVFSTLIAALLR